MTTRQSAKRSSTAERRPAKWRRWRAVWPWLRYLIGLGLAALAIWALLGRKGELSGASQYLSNLVWPWAVLAVVLELASIVAFGMVQKQLLDAGEVTVTPVWITGVTLAATAIANSMPAGPAVSSIFAFRQYRRRGADDVVAVWTLVAVFVAASVSLSLVALAGVIIAGSQGASLDLVGVTVGVVVGALAMGALFLRRPALGRLIKLFLRMSRRLFRWPSTDVDAYTDDIMSRLTAVELGPRRIWRVLGWATANWLLDCGCLAAAFLAVGVGVPWRGLLLAYGAGQLAANLPITPGGLGVVEGSLTIALVAFGGAETSTVAAVLLYRIISFWGELPVGWTIWATLALRGRRQPVQLGATGGQSDVAEVMA